MAGRALGGLGRKLAGQSPQSESAAAKNARHMFEVLGTLKGGAMKFGQALSVFEAAVPEELAAPYREALTKLQTSAPPMPPRQAHRVMAEMFGTSWRDRFRTFDDQAVAAASIGQVHRGVWHDGREVAVKIQYPGAPEAMRSDLKQLQRFSGLFRLAAPGVAVKELIAELDARMNEELDYRQEAEHQRAFARAFADDRHIFVPKVIASAPRAIVSEWVAGIPLATIISSGDQTTRNEVGKLFAEFHYSAPPRAQLLHTDPHPGNFMRTEDGRLGVVDFGSAVPMPEELRRPLGRILRLASDGRAEELVEALQAAGFARQGESISAKDVVDYLAPFTEPIATERFHFTRDWLRQQAQRANAARGGDLRKSGALTLVPPNYLMIHRVTAGAMAVLCQLDAEVPARAIVERWQEGFTE